MPQNPRKLLFAVVVVVVAVNLSLIVLTGSKSSAPLPNPNGYDDFAKAATLLTDDVNEASTLDHEALRTFVSTNPQALRLIRLGLTQQCSFPTDSGTTNVAEIQHIAVMGRPARLLVEEGRLREMENQLAGAAQSYVDAIRYGNEISRGGFLVNRAVGISCEARGCQALARIVPKLGRDEARQVLVELQRVDAGRVKWAEILQNEWRFVRHQHAGRFNPVWLAKDWLLWRAAKAKAETKHNIAVVHERLLAGELALRCYQSDRGRVPRRLDELVTNYLSRLPEDPFSGKAMIYQPLGGTNWLLYSVGPDGVDDGGKSVPGRGLPIRGDLFFDSAW